MNDVTSPASRATPATEFTAPVCHRCQRRIEGFEAHALGIETVHVWGEAEPRGYQQTDGNLYVAKCHGEWEEVYVPLGAITEHDTIRWSYAFDPARDRDPYVTRGRLPYRQSRPTWKRTRGG